MFQFTHYCRFPSSEFPQDLHATNCYLINAIILFQNLPHSQFTIILEYLEIKIKLSQVEERYFITITTTTTITILKVIIIILIIRIMIIVVFVIGKHFMIIKINFININKIICYIIIAIAIIVATIIEWPFNIIISTLMGFIIRAQNIIVDKFILNILQNYFNY